MRNLLLSISVLVCAQLAQAQLPKTNIMLFQTTQLGDSVSLSNAQMLTQFNPQGYNNQPFFMNDDELYISVQYPWDTTQTDIFSLNLMSKEFVQVTQTKESEYSPKLSPDGKGFTVVRVDANNKKMQRLWQYPLDRSNGGTAVLKNSTDIGYYQYITPQKLIAFVVEPEEKYHMSTYEVGTEYETRFSTRIGRCFQPLAGGKVAFMDKSDEEAWQIISFSPSDYQFQTLANIPNTSGGEDFVILPDGTILMGKNSELLYFSPRTKVWKTAANLKGINIKKIERLAINRRGQLAMVVK
jgi:hypothetical protein